MTTTAAATAAPVEITLGGNKYRLSPLGWRDYGEFDLWMREEARKELASQAIAALPDEDRRALHQQIAKQATTLSLLTPPVHDLEALATISRIISSVSGASRLVWYGLRQNHPGIQVETIEALFADGDVLAAAMDEFDRVNDDGKKNRRKKTKRAKSRRGKSR